MIEIKFYFSAKGLDPKFPYTVKEGSGLTLVGESHFCVDGTDLSQSVEVKASGKVICSGMGMDLTFTTSGTTTDKTERLPAR